MSSTETVFIIAQRLGAELESVGELHFVEGARPELRLCVEGPSAERLTRAWQAIQAVETLPLPTSTPKTSGEPRSGGLGQRLVHAGDEDFKWAVWNALELDHGFDVRRRTS